MTGSRRGTAIVVTLAMLAASCRQPSAKDRDNSRLVECVLTAITLRNARLLEDDAKWAAERHESGQLADDDYREIEAIINQARKGDWLAAEEDGYRFRERRPFVRYGR